jgi:hypothetical protein
MNRLRIESVGQIKQADVTLGDLTVLVGPQATGKSIFLQFLKLATDGTAIARIIKRYGYDWKGDFAKFLSLYCGEGMDGLWNGGSLVEMDGARVDFEKILQRGGKTPAEKVFYIPAQRVLVLKNGWPRPFMDYAAGDPFCLRNFSEHIRQLMEAGLGAGQGPIFPQPKRLKKALRDSLSETVFNGASVYLDQKEVQKRLVLETHDHKSRLSYTVWSAGQREFLPLLLGVYWLMPPTKVSRKGSVDWVVIEEPEMGMHPSAVFSLMLLVLEMIYRGYRVVLSTHSPTVLDAVWALRELTAKSAGLESLRDLFGFQVWKDGLKDLFDSVLRRKKLATHFFRKWGDGIRTEDISSLDPGSNSEGEAEWGGLSGFSGHAADVVAKAEGGEYGQLP